jgi:hypothetical protein
MIDLQQKNLLIFLYGTFLVVTKKKDLGLCEHDTLKLSMPKKVIQGKSFQEPKLKRVTVNCTLFNVG